MNLRAALVGLALLVVPTFAATGARLVLDPQGQPFPLPVEHYVADERDASLMEVLQHRVEVEPFNLAATIIFALAILHTFAAPRFAQAAHQLRHAHAQRLHLAGLQTPSKTSRPAPLNFKAEMMHWLGEIEVVFGLWVIPLVIAITYFESWHTAEEYLSHGINYTEPLFVVVIMAIAASRPVMQLAEENLQRLARRGGGTPGAWWLVILTIGPLLGSLITEPAAMTISALLLRRNFYRFEPSLRLRYATLGLLFVNISVGGTLTHFAAPPVLMVAGKWGWGMSDLLLQFGWKAIVGISVANTVYFLVFRREFRTLARQAEELHAPTGLPSEAQVEEEHSLRHVEPVPGWVVLAHVLVLFWTVFTAHYTALYLGGFLAFLAFTQATAQHQDSINLRSPVLVGFFLAGLVIHGTLQQWWISPLLGRLSELPLFVGAAVLTAFNDNAAITYLASLVPNLSPELKYAVVAGAVTGGGLTVIANAPNPAGMSILAPSFGNGLSSPKLLLAALVPTLIMAAAFLVL
jgi:hypothetical protein